MKKICVLVLMLTHIMAEKGFSQIDQTPAVLINTGITFPYAPSNFTKYWHPGFNLGGGAEFLINSSFSLLPYFTYNSMRINKSKLNIPSSQIVGGNVTLSTISLNFKTGGVRPESGLGLYVIGGIGLFQVDQSGVALGSGGSDKDFGFQAGLGFINRISDRYGWFIELKYGYGKNRGKDTQYIPIQLGVVLEPEKK
jgi:opacity protein-like surface antigen